MVAVLSLGCWAFGGADWGGQEDSDSDQALQRALELGITHFDTAQLYGKGRSERVCGKRLREARPKLFIASKRVAGTRDQMLSAVSVSLNRLQTDYIDLYYVHWPRKDVDLRDTMLGLVDARKKHRIRGIGVSNFSVEQMKQIMTVGALDAHQLCYNLLWRWGESDIMPFCRKNDISIVAYSSIAQGILTGKFPKKPRFNKGDLRPKTVLFDHAVWPRVYDCVQELKSIAARAGRPLNHLAIRWAARQPGISSVLVGARNGTQVRQNVAAMHGEIDDSVFAAMTRVSDRLMASIPNTGNIFRHGS